MAGNGVRSRGFSPEEKEISLNRERDEIFED